MPTLPSLLYHGRNSSHETSLGATARNTIFQYPDYSREHTYDVAGRLRKQAGLR